MPTPKTTHTKKELYNEALRKIEECRQEGKRGSLLDLSGLRLTSLPPEIGQLTALTVLYLSGNRFTSLPPEIVQFTALTELNLSGNQLTSLPPEIGQLTALTELYLHGNQLTSLPPEIGQLTALTQLYLHGNQLTSLPPEIGRLTQLERLILEYNALRELPESLKALPRLKELTLHENDTLGLPTEVLGPSWGNSGDTNPPAEPKEILDYYFRINVPDERQPLNEFKLILVGRGGVGKTSLVHRLVHGEFKEFKPTDGIAISQWPVMVEGTKVRAHVWDFGGQEIMHGTHRFFMTERALYLVLVTARENRQQHDAEYWLSLIRSFAGDVPVIVLLHKKGELPCEVDRKIIREKYGEEIEFLETDSKQPPTMGDLCRKIEQMSARLPDLRAAWPKAWHRVKKELPEAPQDWLVFGKFCEFCAARGVPKHEDQEALALALHALGLMLAFRNDTELKNHGVLKPQWATTGIYKMLNAPAIKEAGAKFTLRDFGVILDAAKYPATVHPFLLGLMEKFKLCFPLDEARTRFMIPELLAADEPDLENEFPAAESLGFAYTYDSVLPQGLLPRFIVETFRYRDPAHAWKTGVVLEDDNCRAWVRGDVEGRKISVRVAGPGNGRRAMLAVVRRELKKIHGSFKQLPITELVPVPGHPDVVVPYEKLLKAEKQGRKTVEVVIGETLLDWSVQALLDGVGRLEAEIDPTDEKRSRGHGATIIIERGDYIEGDKSMTHDQSIHIGGSVINSQVGQTLTNCTNMIQQQAPGERKDLLEELERQVAQLLKALPAEKQDKAPKIARDLKVLVEQSTSSEPEREWYSLSAKGVLEAATWVKDLSEQIGGTIKNLGKSLWPDFLLPGSK